MPSCNLKYMYCFMVNSGNLTANLIVLIYIVVIVSFFQISRCTSMTDSCNRKQKHNLNTMYLTIQSIQSKANVCKSQSAGSPMMGVSVWVNVCPGHLVSVLTSRTAEDHFSALC